MIPAIAVDSSAGLVDKVVLLRRTDGQPILSRGVGIDELEDDFLTDPLEDVIEPLFIGDVRRRSADRLPAVRFAVVLTDRTAAFVMSPVGLRPPSAMTKAIPFFLS